MKKKQIIKTALWLLIVFIFIEIGCKYFLYKMEEERLKQSPYFTEYKLSGSEMTMLHLCFYIESTPQWRGWYDNDKLKEEDWPDYSYFTIEETEDTEIVITVMNYKLFEEKSKWSEGAREKAEEYGIDENNRLTVEWVMKHPKEAIKIVQEMEVVWEYGDWQWVSSLYEKITGNSIERCQP